jgi:FlaA1/EpsC-like NDP-sugar epimerase
MLSRKVYISLYTIFRKLRRLPYFSLLILFHDAFMAFFSFFISLYLRISDEFLNYTSDFLLKNIFVFVSIFVGILIFRNTHKVIWKFISVEDLSSLGANIVICNVIFILPMFLLAGDESFSFSILWINIFVLLVLLMIPRLLVKIIHDQKLWNSKKKNMAFSIPVLLIGDETPTELLILEIQSSSDLPYEAVGILTCKKHVEEGQTIHGIPILGNIYSLDDVLKKLENESKMPRQIIITDPKFDKKEKKIFIKKAEEKQLTVLQMIQQQSLHIATEN